MAEKNTPPLVAGTIAAKARWQIQNLGEIRWFVELRSGGQKLGGGFKIFFMFTPTWVQFD